MRLMVSHFKVGIAVPPSLSQRRQNCIGGVFGNGTNDLRHKSSVMSTKPNDSRSSGTDSPWVEEFVCGKGGCSVVRRPATASELQMRAQRAKPALKQSKPVPQRQQTDASEVAPEKPQPVSSPRVHFEPPDSFRPWYDREVLDRTFGGRALRLHGHAYAIAHGRYIELKEFNWHLVYRSLPAGALGGVVLAVHSILVESETMFEDIVLGALMVGIPFLLTAYTACAIRVTRSRLRDLAANLDFVGYAAASRSHWGERGLLFVRRDVTHDGFNVVEPANHPEDRGRYRIDFERYDEIFHIPF